MGEKKATIQNPWVGPSSYQDPAKSHVKVKFCGRENETYDLMQLIDENFLVTLYGKSGNGKTSLLQAGVFPRLRSEQYLPVMLRLGMIEEGKSFQSYIVESIENAVKEISGSVETVPVIEAQSDENAPDYLWNYFARHHFYNKEGETLFPVVVFDQFEEVLRTHENIKRTETLLSQLYYLIDESHALNDCLVDGNPYTYDFNFRFVISIREDELYRLEDCIDNIYLPSLKRCRYRLNSLSRKDAELIIKIPGEKFICGEQQEVINRIIDSATNKDDGNISPFMLSLVCSELFKKAETKYPDNPLITVDMIVELGQNILRDFYLGIVKDLPYASRVFIEDNLVDANSMRNSVNIGMMDIGCPSWREFTDGAKRILQETNGKVELVHDQLALAVFDVQKQRKAEERIKDLQRKSRRKFAMASAVAVLAILVMGFMILLVKNANDANLKMKENQSRAVAGKALDLIRAGDSYGARLLALSVLPEDLENPGDRVYTPEAENALRMALAKENGILRGHTSWVNSASFSPDGQRIVSASNDNTLRLWDAMTGMQIGSPLEGHTSGVNSASFSPDGKRIVSASDDKTIRIWDVATGKQIGKPIEGHKGYVRSAAFSPDGTRIVSVSRDSTLRIWDVVTGKQIGAPLVGHTDWVNSACFSPDGKMIVSTSDDKTLRLWDATTGEQIGAPLVGHDSWANSACFSPDGTRIASASWDKTLRIWDVATGRQIGAPLEGHTEGVHSVSFSNDGKQIVSASWDNTVRLWDASTGEQIGTSLDGHTNWVNSAVFSPDAKRIVSASHDNTLRIWDVTAGKQIGAPLAVHGTKVLFSSFSPDGNMIVSASGDSTLRIWNAATGEQVGEDLVGHTGDVRFAAFSPNSQQIVSASSDSTLRLWDATTGKQIGSSFTGHRGHVRFASFSPDGQRIVSASSDSTLRLWDAATGKQIGSELVGHTGAVRAVSFSQDGTRIVSASSDSTLRLWDAATGKQIGMPLEGHTDWVNSVCFSPDGKRIVSASDDNTIRIWDAATGKQIGEALDGHEGWIRCVAFSPDGKRIVSASWDRTLRLWDVATGRQMGLPLVGHTERVNFASFSPDGKRLISAAWDGTVRTWDWEPLQQLIDETRTRFKNRQLTEHERRTYYLE